MNLTYRKAIRRFVPRVLVLMCLLIFAAGTSYGAQVDVCLRVDQFQIPANTFNNPAAITMWGFVQTGTGAGCNFAAPARTPTATALSLPVLTANAGDTLVIHLNNNLATGPGLYTEHVSVIIPGQKGNFTPTWTDNSTGNRGANLTKRVRSFTAETAQNATTLYTFGPLRAGTYLYQSGTHPAVQVQMGLYGTLRVLPATAGQAYSDATTAFNSEATLLFSEIDAVLHNAVATNTYGPGTTTTSPVNYHPRFFLINGRASSATPPTIAGGTAGQKLLLRFLNAGLDAKVPLVQGPYMTVIAEDGNFITVTNSAGVVLPASRQQYSVLLQPGKTMDAIMTNPATAGTIPVYDRRLNLTNGATSPGGMLAYLNIL